MARWRMPGWCRPRLKRPGWRGLLAAAAGVGILGRAGWAVAGLWGDLVQAGSGAVQALWTVPAALAVHLVQLLLSALGWRVLVVRSPIGLPSFFRLRLMRGGLNTLLPLAHVGGEVIAAQVMTRAGVPAAAAVAGMVVDVTVELCAQLAFLAAGWRLVRAAGVRRVAAEPAVAHAGAAAGNRDG